MTSAADDVTDDVSNLASFPLIYATDVRLRPRVKFGIQPELVIIYVYADLSISLFSWHTLLHTLFCENNLPQTRNCFSILQELDYTHNKHEHLFSSLKNIDAVFRTLNSGVFLFQNDDGDTQDNYKALSTSYFYAVRGKSEIGLWEQAV